MSRWIGRVELVVGPMFSGKTTELIRRARKERAARANVLVFKHAKDTRYDGRAALLSSHDETKLDAIPVSTVAEIRQRIADEPQRVDCVCIEEAQFLAMPVVIGPKQTLYVSKPERVEPSPGVIGIAYDMGVQWSEPSDAELVEADRVCRARVRELVDLVLELRASGVHVILAGLDTDKHRHLWPWMALMAHADQCDKLTAVCADCRQDRAIYSRCTTENASVDDPGGAESYMAICARCWDERDARAPGRTFPGDEDDMTLPRLTKLTEEMRDSWRFTSQGDDLMQRLTREATNHRDATAETLFVPGSVAAMLHEHGVADPVAHAKDLLAQFDMERLRPEIDALVRRVKAAPWFISPGEDEQAVFDLCWEAYTLAGLDDEAAFREVERKVREEKAKA
jgi:thymidine kinase